MTEQKISPRVRQFIILVDRFAVLVSRHWLMFVNLGLVVFVGLPILAPILMHFVPFLPMHEST